MQFLPAVVQGHFTDTLDPLRENDGVGGEVVTGGRCEYGKLSYLQSSTLEGRCIRIDELGS